jgi:hypothetical protein
MREKAEQIYDLISIILKTKDLYSFKINTVPVDCLIFAERVSLIINYEPLNIIIGKEKITSYLEPVIKYMYGFEELITKLQEDAIKYI